MDSRTICVRLRRGDDLLHEIKRIAKREGIKAAVPISAVGCVSKLRVRDASGVDIREVNENCEILSLNGTISDSRCHLHIGFSRRDLSVIGGHLVEGCIINTTCELIIMEIKSFEFGVEQDEETGYDEIIFNEKKA